jgi:hypothetical protein
MSVRRLFVFAAVALLSLPCAAALAQPRAGVVVVGRPYYRPYYYRPWYGPRVWVNVPVYVGPVPVYVAPAPGAVYVPATPAYAQPAPTVAQSPEPPVALPPPTPGS